MSDEAWIETYIHSMIENYGDFPPPWEAFPDTHPYSIGWRMGAGESHIIAFAAWWDAQKKHLNEAEKIAYFRKWPPPARWLTWMFDFIWDLDPAETVDPDSFDYSSHFSKSEALGFGTRKDYEKDIDDEKWLQDF